MNPQIVVIDPVLQRELRGMIGGGFTEELGGKHRVEEASAGKLVGLLGKIG
ncbi:hypothetical protein [Erythrobacter sp. Alg231-14]|uniref:hypothetical protein n=1 Tax=Erythrobacter sp. Alg231-14 TaxID=1922225 RepID=UPI00307C0572